MPSRLTQRFARPSPGGVVEVIVQPPLLNPRVAQYFKPTAAQGVARSWTSLPEIPTSNEITASIAEQQKDTLAPNILQGAWPDRDTYLQNQHKFLREEAVRPLREAVSIIKNIPQADEDALQNAVGIYEKVHIIGWTASTRGIAVRITFSTRRAGKKILWQQSKRLMTGSLVALTPSNDVFNKKTIIALIAARPLEALDQNPPELDIFFARTYELEIDPAVEWTMVEARSAFFEADRHTMLALQKLASEPFPLAKHIVHIDTAIDTPKHIEHNPINDLSSLYGAGVQYEKVDVIKSWPHSTRVTLDESQQQAVQRMFTSSLAIIQGPPGTGKTFVSVTAVKTMLANATHDSPPIIVTAQTNHALDQILRHIAEFEPSFVRLGGRSKDQDVILKRTLYNVRKETERKDLPGSSARPARSEMWRLGKLMEELLQPLTEQRDTARPIDQRLFTEHALLTIVQTASLEEGARRWVQSKREGLAESDIQLWAKRSMHRVPYKPELPEFGFDYEEDELEFEDLQDVEAENAIKDDDFVDSLKGNFYTLADNFTAPSEHGVDDSTIKNLLARESDMWKIPEAYRGPVYRYLQSRLKQILLEKFRALAQRYDTASHLYRIGQWECDEVILRKQRVIGCTTTGLSKYRGLIAALGCKVVLVEEAAETLEAPVLAACLPTLEQLILVGDHKQLRPHCKVREHEKKPLYYNYSLFERLVNNQIDLTTLLTQRRMIPEIRRLLRPIYNDIIQDHDSVKKKPDVPGMGGINSYFFQHDWPERRDDLMSCINDEEAAMIVGFVTYLVDNGVAAKDITILTFYNGQRKRLLRHLRRADKLRDKQCPVVTVDSYQGEENKIVILSLVRSNQNNSIGFLSNGNRVCVALSRAQQGCYIFGNAMPLNKFKIWSRVLKIMCGKDDKNAEEIPTIEPQRFHEVLPITCSNHANTIKIAEPADWEHLSGGCLVPCSHNFSCGHDCTLNCHPFDHTLLGCLKPCVKMLSCGHQCSVECGQNCICRPCEEQVRSNRKLRGTRGSAYSSGARSTDECQSHAVQENEGYVRLCQTPTSARVRTTGKSSDTPLKEELLIEI